MPSKNQNGLASRLQDAAPSAYANRCAVARLLLDLPDDDKIAVKEALVKVTATLAEPKSGNNRYTAKWLSKTLAEFGHKISDTMIRRHCHGMCSCES